MVVVGGGGVGGWAGVRAGGRVGWWVRGGLSARISPFLSTRRLLECGWVGARARACVIRVLVPVGVKLRGKSDWESLTQREGERDDSDLG